MKIIFSSNSKKQLKKLNLRFQEKIIEALEKFEKGERLDIKKLKARKNEYRIRIGDYRIILKEINTNEFLISKIAPRRNIYFLFI